MTTLVDFPVKPEARPYLGAALGAPGEPDWLIQQRRRALARFAERGFPSRRGEAWRYLDLRPLEQHPMLPAARGALGDVPREMGYAEAWTSATIVNGICEGIISQPLPQGIWVAPTRRAVTERPELVVAAVADSGTDHPFGSLNEALFADGYVVDMGRGAALDRAIQVIHFASKPGSAHTRSMIRLAAGCRATLVETYAGNGEYWRNDVLIAELGERASLSRIAVVEESAEAVHFGEVHATLAAGAKFTSFALLLGGRTVRSHASVMLAGDGAQCGLYGAFLAGDRQEANIVTEVEHHALRGETREVFKGVAAGRGHGAFQGRITVQRGAQKTDAHMLSRNLVLGPRAAIDTKPELEIFADDVKCSHGAAVGDLDEAALFYLLTRGIPRAAARRILIEAFVREAMDAVEPPALREHLRDRLARRLATMEE